MTTHATAQNDTTYCLYLWVKTGFNWFNLEIEILNIETDVIFTVEEKPVNSGSAWNFLGNKKNWGGGVRERAGRVLSTPPPKKINQMFLV